MLLHGSGGDALRRLTGGEEGLLLFSLRRWASPEVAFSAEFSYKAATHIRTTLDYPITSLSLHLRFNAPALSKYVPYFVYCTANKAPRGTK